MRNKLRVTLRADDGREANADALDLLSEMRLRLFRKQQEQGYVDDWEAYAATTAHHVCNDYLRSKYPQRTRLKNALRRVLDKADEYSVWSNAPGDLMCGFVGQRNAAQGSEVSVQLLQGPERMLPEEVLIGSPAGTLDPEKLLTISEAIFECCGGPIPLDHLIGIVGLAWGVQEAMPVAWAGEEDDEGTAPADTVAQSEPNAESHWMAKERLTLLWGAVLELLAHHRAAYLLNLRDGELDAFPYYGVASMAEIGEALALTDTQYRVLAKELAWDDDLRAKATILTGGQRFLICWRYLPVEDNVIAAVLNVTRSQVINYRTKGIERLRRTLRGVL